MLNEVTDTPSATQEPPSEKQKTTSKTAFWKDVVLWVSFGVLLILIIAALTPRVRGCPHGNPVGTRGRDIYVAITGANTDREPLGLRPVWPKTQLEPGTDTSTGDIATKTFTNSTDYFYELYDGQNVGSDRHDPYVKGFDYSKLAGAGVPAKVGGGKLTAKNNMWLIAANITEDDDDVIPVLITRNVDVKELERYINHSGGRAPDDTRIELGKGKYKTPYGEKGFVVVRKGGGTFGNQAKYATLRVIFNSKTLPPRDPSKPPIVYLMP